MSSVLTLQIAHALFPWMRSQPQAQHQPSPTSSPSTSTPTSNEKPQHSHRSIPLITIEPAEHAFELLPLLMAPSSTASSSYGIKRSKPAIRHRRSSSASSASSMISSTSSSGSSSGSSGTSQQRQSFEGEEEVAPFPHVGLTSVRGR